MIYEVYGEGVGEKANAEGRKARGACLEQFFQRKEKWLRSSVEEGGKRENDWRTL